MACQQRLRTLLAHAMRGAVKDDVGAWSGILRRTLASSAASASASSSSSAAEAMAASRNVVGGRSMAETIIRPPTFLPVGVKKYKPTTPGFRHRVITSRIGLWQGKPYDPLVRGKKRIDGRNNSGRICVWGRGGGHKRKRRVVDFKRKAHWGVDGRIVRFEYDPNRSAHIALVRYDTEGVDDPTSREWLLSPLPGSSQVAYILAAHGMEEGQVVQQGPDASLDVGNAMPLRCIPMGTTIHNIELVPGRGAAMARSAGTSATLLRTSKDDYVMIRLTSGEVRLIHENSMATIGTVSNGQHKQVNHGKAGARRWLGWRPQTRGVAMNPVDHPHGGGEGKTSGGRPSVSPWGKPSKGGLTRKRRGNIANPFIVKGRPRGKKHQFKTRVP